MQFQKLVINFLAILTIYVEKFIIGSTLVHFEEPNTKKTFDLINSSPHNKKFHNFYQLSATRWLARSTVVNTIYCRTLVRVENTFFTSGKKKKMLCC